jgi:pyruvate carboxylase
LDAGNAYAGATISPFFDSMLVKVTSWAHTLPEAADRLHRALREFRIRGVKSNIPFLLNVLKKDVFRSGKVTVNFIGEHPELLEPPGWKDRGTKLLRYLGNIIVNGNDNVKLNADGRSFVKPIIPDHNGMRIQSGTKQILEKSGPSGIVNFLKSSSSIHYTDTTFRDAHQSLLATRVRSIDMLNVADSYAHHVAHQLFSMEVWGGATFDVSMRFLRESPWKRLENLRKKLPNVMLQMLLRGSNAVGYKAYPDNLVEEFVVQAAETGIDVFRIFDSLNWVEAMKVSIKTILQRTNSIAEACICYTGDVLNTQNNRFNIDYYKELAKEIEDTGAHILAIKDMAGLLKPQAAAYLITELKNTVDLPIHLHTHDTTSIQSTTYLSAVEAGVDIIDMAASSMSGITSQPNFNSFVAMLDGHARSNPITLPALNQFSDYWEVVRSYYFPFETELKAGTAEVYDHEIPGGQYSNLRPQARGLGLEDKFEIIKDNYKKVNDLLGGIVKVTPSSKVVGDMAMFMTSNNLNITDLIEKSDTISYPDSIKSLMRGDLGQWKFGWPEAFQKAVLKDEKPYTERPNAHLEAINFESGYEAFKTLFIEHEGYRDYISWLLYPKVFEEYHRHKVLFGEVTNLPTKAFFFGLKHNEEISVHIAKGKTILIQYLNMNEPDEYGNRLVIFRINGTIRSVVVKDKSILTLSTTNQKVSGKNDIGSPLQGSLSKILVTEGEKVEKNQPIFIIEAMKMETTVTSSKEGVIKAIHLKERTLVEQDDLVISLE